jgi:N6-adenosine-specific RNA methylase IME4
MGKIARRQDILPVWYIELLNDLKDLAYTGIVCTKHAIGKRILRDELKFNKPEYGSKRIENLAKDMEVSRADLYRCIQFAKAYPELSPVGDFSWRYIKNKLLPARQIEKPTTLPLPEGKYNVIYADPPWKYADTCEAGAVQSKGADKHYPIMSIEQLCELEVKEIAPENAVLFLWVTSPLLEECFEVIRAWGFKYKASFVWDKVKHNMGHYNSVRHEFLLICIKGSFLPENKELFDSVQSIERTKHSEKPERFRQIIEALYPKSKKIELFARKKVKGWDSYGDDSELQR